MQQVLPTWAQMEDQLDLPVSRGVSSKTRLVPRLPRLTGPLRRLEAGAEQAEDGQTTMGNGTVREEDQEEAAVALVAAAAAVAAFTTM